MLLYKTFDVAVRRLLLLLLALFVHSPAGSAAQLLVASDLDSLQGQWQGEGPPGEITITIEGNSLHFFARSDFWYDATFVLPTDAAPKQLHATLTDSSPPENGLGEVVFSIFKVENAILTLAVDDGSYEPPASFSEATSRYILEKVEPGAAVPEAETSVPGTPARPGVGGPNQGDTEQLEAAMASRPDSQPKNAPTLSTTYASFASFGS